MFWALVVSAIHCEVGERMSNIWVEIDDDINSIEWYLLSTDTRKSIITIMSFTQRPVILDGLGSISGSRELFKKVSLSKRRLQICFVTYLFDFR